MRQQIEWLPIGAVTPYEKNARINDAAVPLVAASIKQFGFKNPIIVDRNHVIICGHTRLRAAKELGLSEVPVVVAGDLTEEQVRAYRLADNKVSEASKWDVGLLAEELSDLSSFSIDMGAFGFDDAELFRRQAAWSHMEKFCDLKRRVKLHSHGDMVYGSFFETGKRGIPIAEIKENGGNIEPFAECLCDVVEKMLGSNLKAGDWALVTAPRRRHKDGLHFATEICRAASSKLGIAFYSDAFRAEDRNRLEPTFIMEKEPTERNVLCFDDVTTTGSTMRAMRELLIGSGHVVLLVIGIKN